MKIYTFSPETRAVLGIVSLVILSFVLYSSRVEILNRSTESQIVFIICYTVSILAVVRNVKIVFFKKESD